MDGMAAWMKNCGASCWPGARRTSGSATWHPRRRDSTWPGSPTRWRRNGSASMRKTPGGLANFSAPGAGQGGRWPTRRAPGPGRRGCWPSTLTVTPVRQRAFLHALRGAVDQGEASPAQLAYLEDRVRIDAGQPQLYGTQFTVTDGEFGPPVAPSFRVQSGQGTGERLTSGTPVPADAR